MGGQWAAIVITLVAATGNNVGKALQKEATRQLPRFSLEPAIMVQYARSREWLIGLATDLGGALLMIAAFALAPVSSDAGQPVRLLAARTLHRMSSGRWVLRCRFHWCSRCLASVWYRWRSFRTSI